MQPAIDTNPERTPSPSSTPANDRYGAFCRPKLAELLAALRLDLTYERASGSTLHPREELAGGSGEGPVLDLVSGFGACLLGHNHPELKQALVEALDRDLPMLTQSSIRAGAGELAERLNALIPAEGRYLCSFANSGAEANEAALKHAYRARFEVVRREYERIARQLNDLCARIEEEELAVELPPRHKDLNRFRDDLDELNLAQLEAFRQAPVVIALKGSFHGKTSGALKVTFNKSYREGYEGLSAIRPIFIDPEEVERLPEIVAEERIELLAPRLEGSKIVIDRVMLSKAIALIFEVIAGEGGVRPLPLASLESLARLHPTLELPYIIDEVQTGCGRTGSFLAYAETPLCRIEPEYLTLSKALGGGLVKIGATLIHERVYDPDFGILHTSTFAEDDLSCAVAGRVLDLLTRDGGALLLSIREKGAYLLAKLRLLQARYPEVVAEVRGRGLMIGIELRELQDRSPLFRYAGKQGFLSLLVSSYLLHHHRIRVFAPLTTLLKGNPGKKRQSVLRIQPPATITREEIDRAVAALDEVLRIVDRNNEYLLIAHLVGERPSAAARREPERMPVLRPLPARRADFDARIGFILHPTELDQIVEYHLPSFRHYPWSRKNLARWWTDLARFLEPDHVHTEYVELQGFVVEVNLVTVPFLPGTMAEALVRSRRGRHPSRADRLRLLEIQDKVQDAVTVARELGDDHVPTSVVGLGAFTSIVTGQGTTINDFEVPVTTGNAYTAALMIQAIERAAEVKGAALEDADAAVIGAAGNIGSVLAAMLALRTRRVKLIGRCSDEGLTRLEQVRRACLQQILIHLRRELENVDPAAVAPGGLVGEIYREVLRPCLEAVPLRPELRALRAALTGVDPISEAQAALLDQVLAARHGGSNPFLTLHTDLASARDCEVVAVATSSTDGGLIGPGEVKQGAIVCSASVPSNLSQAFGDRLGDYLVFDGGLARLPEGNAINWVGQPRGGLAFGCLTETLLLGLDGRNRSFAKGPLTVAQVEHTLELAERHGITLGELKLAQEVHPLIRKDQGRRSEP